ncbi:ead/Ea22-like family protein [Citrobacter freundii]|uniref:ead/Ea22-like family protein n=1 Tax=Citrobacter freundii TaxID=546 RepID=UPI00244987E1|nr:ead/Ea22-like family protein [Citrobacter freundii]MDH0387985.1 ead/Ea22-like family protein [Citrobacter freundii]MEB0963459.1 ead/Ea22-like family protein [Citrobacter freundii]
MTALNKQALRERYSSQPVPKCHICGAEMTVQRMSASRITYGCTGATYDDKGCHYAEGRSIADDHYEQSRVTVVDVSDPEVLAMLDELEAKDVALSSKDYHFDQDAGRIKSLEKALESAERRIAELEAIREVFLRAKALMYQSGGAPIENSLNPIDAWLYDAELAAAGIGVKGE